MKFDKMKIFSIVGIVLTGVIGTLFSTSMQDREIEKAVERHFATENKEEES